MFKNLKPKNLKTKIKTLKTKPLIHNKGCSILSMFVAESIA